MMKHCITLILLCGAFVRAYSQGTAFSYQGRLTDGASPVNGFYDLQFAIYDAASGGSAVAGPVTNMMIAVSNGLFTATLDFGASVFPGADRWLEIGVRPYGGGAFATLSPRQKLTPTPYAITASNLTGTASAATNFTGLLAGDVIGPQSATVVWSVGGQSAANVAGGASAANAATSANTANAIVKRDASGNFSAGAITVGSISGDGSGLSNLMAAKLTGTISPNNIAAGSINSTMLAAGAVGSTQLASGAVTADKVATVLGSFVLTITNPVPAELLFGLAVTAVGSDRIAVGASGEAYLFNINGGLLTAFTNPISPGLGGFGGSVAAVGSDRVLIGAQSQVVGGVGAGAAFLFTSNGTLLATPPTP